MDKYNEAHLFVSAIRLLQHKLNGPPSIKDLCDLIEISEEIGSNTSRKLQQLDIIDILEDPFSIRLMVKNHLNIENIPKGSKNEKSLADELTSFQNKRNTMDEKVATIQKDLKKKKDTMFAELEAKLKKEIDK